MIERYFEISNYRSIGVLSKERIELNCILDSKKKMGGVVTLIGENNSGKSNYLDAVRYFDSKIVEPKDIPHHNYDPDVHPAISLFIKKDDNTIKLKAKLKNGKVYYDRYENGNIVEQRIQTELSSPSKFVLDTLLSKDFIEQAQLNGRMLRVYNTAVDVLKKLSKSQKINISEFTTLTAMITSPHVNPQLLVKAEAKLINDFTKEVKNVMLDNEDFVNLYSELNKICNKEFGIDLVPSIIEYDDNKKISTVDTFSIVSNGIISNKVFFSKLYSLLKDEEISELENVYKKFSSSGSRNKFHLTNYESKINKSLVKLSELFNSIYSFNEIKKYSFRIDMESEKIFFIISENGMDISLDSQSTGFKWFFNFFFNVFADTNLKNGDIIIMDEPATNLHVAGQVELRKQIKDFGMKNGITFLISTHSPFLIDPDYLDEIRLIKKVEQESKIINKFTVNEDSEFDVLLPIKSALTVNRHILLDPNDILVFVEGITDYNYLVAFKQLFNMNNINFMPIQGIKRNNIFKELIKITKTPVILVDSDKAGKSFKEKNKDNVAMEIHELNDINAKFKEIEDLFSEKDRKDFCDKKNYKLSSIFKNNVIEMKRKISTETKDNFRSLLDHLTT